MLKLNSLKYRTNSHLVVRPLASEPSRVELGGLFSALAGVSVAAAAAIVKWGSYAFSTEFLLVVRFAAGLAAILAAILIQRRAIPYRTSHSGLLSLIAFLWVGAVYCCYFALRFIPLVDAILLINTGPLFAPLISRLFLKKPESLAVWLGIGLGFVGVVIVLRPGAGIIDVHALIGLMAGLLLAVRLVVTSFITGKEPREVITFYSLGVGTLICLGILAVTGCHLANWERLLFPPQDWLRPWIIYPSVLLALVALGILSMLNPWFTATAYEYGSVGQTGPFRYAGVIFAALADWLCWGVVPDWYSILGFICITAGGIWVIRHEDKK
jgi:drug/metabolite transporter (DMT)-like permease